MASTERTGYGTGTVASSRERDLVLFTLRDGRQLPTAKTYQLWFIGADGSARSAGLLPDAANADTTSLVAGSLGDAHRLGVTVEPAGGSRQPTTNPVMLVRLR